MTSTTSEPETQLEQLMTDLAAGRLSAISSRLLGAMGLFYRIGAVFLLIYACLVYLVNPILMVSRCYDGCICRRLRDKHWYGTRQQVIDGQSVAVSDSEGTAQTMLSLFVAFALRSMVSVGLRASTEGKCGEDCEFGVEVLFSIFVGIGVWAAFRLSKWVASIVAVIALITFAYVFWTDPDPWIQWSGIALIVLVALIGAATKNDFYEWMMQTLCVIISSLVIVYVSSYFSQTDLTQFDSFRKDVFSDERVESDRRRALNMILFVAFLSVNQICWLIAFFFALFGERGWCHCVTENVRDARTGAAELKQLEHLIGPTHPGAAEASSSDDDDDYDSERGVAKGNAPTVNFTLEQLKQPTMTRTDEA